MHFCKAKIAIGGDNRNVFVATEFSPVSWPEVLVLQAVHGEQSIDEVEPFVAIDQSPRDERFRLGEKYGEEVIDNVFGGKQGRPHEIEAPQELPDQARWAMLSERYVFLARRAYRQELISRARLAECLATTENDTALRLLRYVASVTELSTDEEPQASRRT